MISSRTAGLPVCAALFALPLICHAQAAAPPLAAAPSVPTAPVPPIVEPAARELFLQMVTAQKALHAFVATVDTQDRTGGTVVAQSQGRSRIVFSAPARASVTVTQQGKVLGQIFSNGTALTRVDTAHKSYRQDTLPAGVAARIVSAEIGNLGLLPHSLIDPAGLVGLLSAPGLVAVALGAAEGPVGGVPVDSVVARIVGSDSAEGKFTFVIGHADHLLRQVIVQETPPGAGTDQARAVTHTETISALQVNPSLPASTFVYKPQPGFKKAATASR